MYVCTEKAAIQEWLKEIEWLKKDIEKRHKYWLELEKMIVNLSKENKQLKKDKKLLLSDYKWLLKDKRELEKENKELKIELWMYQSLFKDKIEPYWCWIWEKFTEEDIEKAIKKYFNTNQKWNGRR